MNKKKIITGFAMASVPVSAAISTGVVAAAELPSIQGSSRIFEWDSNGGILDEQELLEGLKAYDFDGTDITSEIKILGGSVDTSIVGEHKVVYSVTNSQGNSMETTFIHLVRDSVVPSVSSIEPAHVLMSQADENGAYNIDWKSYAVFDDNGKNPDGSLIGEYKVEAPSLDKAGEYQALVTFIDQSGNKATAKIPVVLEDDVAPVISVEDVTVDEADFTADSYKKGIISVIDNNDGDISKNATVKFEDISADAKHKVYKYTVTAKDAAGNSASEDFVLTVVKNSAPTIKGPSTHTMLEGEELDFNSLLTAEDIDGDEVTIKNLTPDVLDTNTPGVYELEFQAEDAKGALSEIFKLTVTVESKMATVTFVTNTGEVVDPIKVEKGKTVALPELTNGDKAFLGWFLDSGFKQEYKAESIVEKDITLYAKWEKDIMLTFVNPGEKSQVFMSTNNKAAEAEPVSPSKEGWEFIGWKDRNGEEFYSKTNIYESNMVFESVFKEIPVVYFDVTFNPNNGEENKVISVKEGEMIELVPEAPSKPGYKFLGWYIGDKAYDETTIVEGDIVVEAKWKEIVKYNVTFKPNNGQSDFVQVVEEGDSINHNPGIPTREGYKFLGWFANGVEYDASMIPTSDMVVEGRWEQLPPPIVYVYVGFDPQNGNAPVTYKVEEGSSISESIATPQKEGYKFLGWYNSQGTKYTSGMRFNTNDTFTAKWKKDTGEEEPPIDTPKVEISIIDYDYNNVPVGHSFNLLGDGGLFEGYIKVDGENIAFNLANLKANGVSIVVPEGVSLEGNTVRFNKSGTFNITATYKGKTIASTVNVIVPQEQEDNIRARVSEITMFAGQSFDPMSQVIIDGSSDVSVMYINLSNGETVNLNINAVPFGKYSVVYTQKSSGKQVSITLVAVTPPQNTEGGKPSLLVKDNIIALKGEPVDLKSFAQAADTNGNSLTGNIVVSGNVDWDKAGKYEVVFSVKDANGLETTKTVTVEVMEKEKYDAEISRQKGDGIKVQTSDESAFTSYTSVQTLILGSAATGVITLLVKKKKELETEQ